MTDLNYYWMKILSLARKHFLSSVDGVIYVNSKKKFRDYDVIYFYFDCPKLMHLGDHLYFKPLIKKLCDNGYNIIVSPISGMSFAFPWCRESADLNSKRVLFVSRLELMLCLREQFGDVDYLLYDTMSSKIDMPISNYILSSFCKYFNLDDIDLNIKANDYLDFDIDKSDKFDLASKKRVVFLSNYVDSGRFRIFGKDKHILIERLKEECRDCYVVHLGTKKDADNDNIDYEGIVDLDLRGLTAPEDIFSLMLLDNIQAVYCHDTFILHAANFFNIKINLLFKKYFFYNEQKRRAFASLFIKNDYSNIKFL